MRSSPRPKAPPPPTSCTRACCRMSSVCRCRPHVRTSTSSGSISNSASRFPRFSISESRSTVRSSQQLRRPRIRRQLRPSSPHALHRQSSAALHPAAASCTRSAAAPTRAENAAPARCLPRRAQLRQVSVQPRLQLRRNRPPAASRRQLLEHTFCSTLQVMLEQQPPRHRHRLRRSRRRHKRIAVAVAANPRTEPQHDRQVMQSSSSPAAGNSASSAARNLRIQHRNRLEQRSLVVVQRHANFIAHRRPRAAHIVGLPQRCDLRRQIALQRIELATQAAECDPAAPADRRSAAA